MYSILVFEDVINETTERFGVTVDSRIDGIMTQKVNDNVFRIANEAAGTVPPTQTISLSFAKESMRDLESVLWFTRYPSEKLTIYVNEQMRLAIGQRYRYSYDVCKYLSTTFNSLAAHSLMLGATYAYAKAPVGSIRSNIIIEPDDLEKGCHLLFRHENLKGTWIC